MDTRLSELEPAAHHRQLVASHSNDVWVRLAATFTCIGSPISAHVWWRDTGCVGCVSSEAVEDAVIQSAICGLV